MTTVIGYYDYVFDSVSFGIDVRARRTALGLSQEELAATLGYKTGGVISGVETAIYDEYLNMRDYMKLCNFLELTPSNYFDMQKSDGADISAGWEL